VAAITTGSKNLKSYLARPSGIGPWPGVVVIHEVWGLDDVVRRQTDRMAAAGCLALAPDLFSDGGMVRCLAATMASMVPELLTWGDGS
jgi:carboxymethylenebutenolidase